MRQRKRALSLYRQGDYWYQAILAMGDQRLEALHFDQVVREQEVFEDIFGSM